jgi:hypothetical protein
VEVGKRLAACRDLAHEGREPIRLLVEVMRVTLIVVLNGPEVGSGLADHGCQ